MARPDHVTRVLLAVIAAALTWIAIRPEIVPRAEAAREIVTVNLERIGGRFLGDGAVPIRCADLPR